MNILIVEDDINIQKLIISSIQEVESDVEVYTTDRSMSALEIATENSIDIFILDIQLTDYKGTKLAKELRTMEQYRYTPMIFATALANEEINAYREIKCYSFLIKPFTKEEVKQTISEAIDYRNHFSEKIKSIRIEQKSHIFEYNLSDIIYIESFRKKMTLHLQTDQNGITIEEISGYTLKGMLELINDAQFVQCHKSYIINKSYIVQISKVEGQIALKNVQQSIPIGNKFRTQLLGNI
ncbi:DNA-binding response regulator [Bacillus sp. J14TS2]|uniref:LytR/AlgR family response regulator transcription factor n=1 Tax=Bacillus sp. J14TS2 TaxID=2807188 RepID=UPI001B19A216|nr:LytTR family DNA-binding domain-containing protein [Bacillus sp. J14TS2]GIN74078.1 DNA-binding response regulator [Bacillus sp. J14TS2]